MKPTRGLPIVLSAPSGGGKSTIAAEVLRKVPSTVRSISCTTRSPRSGELEGTDYFFVTEEQFHKKRKAGHFLEWAEVHRHFYGTPIEAFEKELEKGKDVILTIDPQGAVSIRRIYPNGVFIFVVPPSWEVLKKRLSQRGADDDESLQVRLANARKELETLHTYDYLILNDDLARAVEDVHAILRAEHRRLTHLNKKDIPILDRDNVS